MEKLSATGTLSKLSSEEIDIISKIEKIWYATKLRNYGVSQTINIDGNHSRWNGTESVIVIDITKEPWVKILGHMNGATQVHGVTDIVMNNHIHNTCGTPISLLEGKGSRWCPKCKCEVNDTVLWSNLGNCILKPGDNIGIAIVDIEKIPILLIDYDYEKREYNKETLRIMVKIKATNYLSDVSKDENILLQDYIIRNKIRLHSKKFGGGYDKDGEIYLPREGNPLVHEEKVLVIDISNDNWKKKFGTNHNKTEIHAMADIVRLHKKEKYDNNLWSVLGDRFFTTNDDIGSYVIKDIDICDYSIVLIDYEYNWKKEKNADDVNVLTIETTEERSSVDTMQIGEDIDKQPGEDISTKVLQRKIDSEVSDEGQERIDTESDIHISMYVDNHGHGDIEEEIDEYIPKDIPDKEKDDIKTLYNEERSKIHASVNEYKGQILKSKVKDYCTQIEVNNKIREKTKEQENLEIEQKKKEDERRAKIDRELDIISNLPYNDIERMLHYNKNVDLDGPPYVGKTYSAKDCAVRYISRFVEAETDDKLNEFISKGYIEIFPSHSNLDYSDFVEGYKYDESGRPVLKPGILKIMSSRALGSVIRLDDKDINNKKWIEIFGVFKEKKNIMSRKEIDGLFKYAVPRILIIPDITRGDVASILGPTNTIIDKPYRLGETEGMPIILPDSGEEFGIPSILHIIIDRNNAIGTSISYLDEATERRFPTKFMSSNFDDIQKYINDNRKELESKGTYDILLASKKAMIKLNKKIIKKFGKDKELGHCYLYVKTPYELFTQWKNLIIPLIFRHRCRRDYKELNNILFNDDESQWISHEEGIHGLNNIEDLKNFIDKINSIPEQNE